MLEVKDVEKSFGGLKAVAGCTLSVQEGTITGLIGPNPDDGFGKPHDHALPADRGKNLEHVVSTQGRLDAREGNQGKSPGSA